MKRLPDTELEVMKALWASERAPGPPLVAGGSSAGPGLSHQYLQHLSVPSSGEGLCILREAGQDQLLHPPGPSGGLSGL